jgi:hypothetical protein
MIQSLSLKYVVTAGVLRTNRNLGQSVDVISDNCSRLRNSRKLQEILGACNSAYQDLI